MSYRCEVIDRVSQPVLSIRTISSIQEFPQLFSESYAKIRQYLEELSEIPRDAPFAGYFNTDMQNIDIEIGIPVSQEFSEKDDIKPSEIPKGQYAACIYTGPYSEIAPAYDALTQWVNENGYESSGIAYELYIDDPGVVSPEELKTQVLFLLK